MLKTVSTQLALASDTLSEILAKGNTSGPNNIIMDAGYGITATTGTFSGDVTVVGGVKTAAVKLTGDSIHFKDDTNSAATGYINYFGYQTGLTQFRNTVIADGRGGAILSLDGSTGAATFSDNIIIGTSGKGIDFSATAGTGTSELLDDYEEGTWTPVVSGSTTAGTYEIGTNGSTYTKVGRTVTLQGYIRFAAVVTGGGTGILLITGLPFAKTANSGPAGSVYLALGTFAGISPIVAFGSFGASSQLVLQQNATGGYGTNVDISFASANAYLTFTITYEV
jgi:hypothetical protein